MTRRAFLVPRWLTCERPPSRVLVMTSGRSGTNFALHGVFADRAAFERGRKELVMATSRQTYAPEVNPPVDAKIDHLMLEAR